MVVVRSEIIQKLENYYDLMTYDIVICQNVLFLGTAKLVGLANCPLLKNRGEKRRLST